MPVPIRFIDRGHVLMSDGWVVRGACVLYILPILPLTSARCCSLQHNRLDASAKEQLQRAAGTHLTLAL